MGVGTQETDIAFQNGMLCGMAQKGFLTQNIHIQSGDNGGSVQICKFSRLPNAGLIREFKEIKTTGSVEALVLNRIPMAAEKIRNFGEIKTAGNVEILLVEEV